MVSARGTYSWRIREWYRHSDTEYICGISGPRLFERLVVLVLVFRITAFIAITPNVCVCI